MWRGRAEGCRAIRDAHTREEGGMKDDERRTRDMGVRVVLEGDRHPDTDPAHDSSTNELIRRYRALRDA